MEAHILNGDSLAYEFVKTNIPGSVVVCRECLIVGPVKASSLAEFWRVRANYIAATEKSIAEGRDEKVVSEFDKLTHLSQPLAINLWFEDDLFCQTNMWFMLYFLRLNGIQGELFRVFPKQTTGWRGFGPLNAADLIECLRNRVPFRRNDFDLGVNLWTAYQASDFRRLTELSGTTSPCFHHLKEVVEAHIERFPESGGPGRPERVLKEIVGQGETDFHKIFAEFFNREGIYGFGDLQVNSLIEKI